MKYAFIIPSFLLLAVCQSSCTNRSRKIPDRWNGDYFYEETPVKANAGYYMAMTWSLTIHAKEKLQEGVLEVNGQQTFIKSQITIVGDTNTIAIVYDHLLDGVDEQFKKGDTLFTLSERPGGLTTKWFVMEPRLHENPPGECDCFRRKPGKR